MRDKVSVLTYMEKYTFANNNFVAVTRAYNNDDVRQSMREFFDLWQGLPENRNARIVVKPNFNNDINGLMSNSTDLRVIVGAIRELKNRGYHDITIAEGPNGGVVRQGIDVFKRLRIDRIAKKFDVKFVDLNKTSGVPKTLTNNEPIELSEACLNADVFINLPKVKTHWEAGLSLSSKNIMGCLVGFSKKKMHFNFFPNILRLNELVRPHFHIVDGLVAMEGQGPGDGKPRTLNLLVAGTNPYLTDLVVTKLVGFNIKDVGYVRLAYERGLISPEDVAITDHIQPIAHLIPSHQPLLTKFATARWLTPVRSVFRPVFQHSVVNGFLRRHKIMQDTYVSADDEIHDLTYSAAKCPGCEHGKPFCPMGLDPTKDLQSPDCIQCLYCVFTCPNESIEVHGNLGFLASQLERYKEFLKKL